MPKKLKLKREQIEIIIIVVLVMGAVFIGISMFSKKGKIAQIFSKKKFTEKLESAEILEKEMPKEKKAIAYVDFGRMPFKGPFDDIKIVEIVDEQQPEEDVELPAMNFQGMIWNSLRPQVIINNQVYDINDTLDEGGGEVRIKSISKDGVYLEYKKKEFIVRPK